MELMVPGFLSALFSWNTFWWALVAGVIWILVNSVRGASSKGTQENETGGQGRSGAKEEPDEADQDDTSGQFGQTVRLKPQAPEGASGEIERILNARDYFAVMDVPRDCDASDIKKAFRSKLLITHPDKNQGVIGALEASQRINAANDTLSDDVKRKQYYIRLIDEEQNGRRPGGAQMPSDIRAAAEMFNEYCKAAMGPAPPGAEYPSVNPADYDPWNSAPNHVFHMPCSCGFDHIAVKVPSRNSLKARNCRCTQCAFLGMGNMLPARHNDVWFETPHNVLRYVNPDRFIRAYRCVGTYVYDITDWCRCGGLLSDNAGYPAPTNTHHVPFRMQGHTPSRAKEAREGTGYNEFKGGGANSHKNRKKKKGRR